MSTLLHVGAATAGCDSVSGVETINCPLDATNSILVVNPGARLDGATRLDGAPGNITIDVAAGGTVQPTSASALASVDGNDQSVFRYAGDGFTSVVNNAGTIQVDAAPVDLFSIVSSNGNHTFNNTGTIRNLDPGGANETIALFGAGNTLTVNNRGLIQGAANPAVGLYFAGGSPNVAFVTNFVGGRIVAVGDAVRAVGGGPLQLRNAGTIDGNVVAPEAGGRLTLEGTSVITGSVVFNAAELVLAGASNGTFAVDQVNTTWSGFSAFRKTDAGTWTLTGSNTSQAFPWDVEGGRLALTSGTTVGDGSGTWNVRSGAFVSGLATIGGSLVNAGTVETGTGGGIGTLNVSGNYTHDASATLRVGFGGVASVGKLAVGGDATLASGATLSLNVTGATGVTNNVRVQDVILATGTLTRGAINVVDNSVLFDFTADSTRDPKAVDLIITALPTPVHRSVTEIGNSVALPAAQVLDQLIITNPEVGGLFASLGSTQSVADAAQQALPAVTGGTQLAAMTAFTSMNRVVQARIEDNRGLSSGDAFEMRDRRFWLKPFTGRADQGNRGAAPGFDARNLGFALGFDDMTSDRTRLGLSLAYANASVDSSAANAPSRARTDVVRLLGYGTYTIDERTDANFQVGVGQNFTSSRRDVLAFSRMAEGGWRSDTLTVGGGIGRLIDLREDITVTPSIRADYTWLRDRDYTETGAGALNLSVRGRTTSELIVYSDAKVNYRLPSGVILTGNGGLGYDLIDKDVSVLASFVGGGPAFVTNGLNVSPWLVRFGAGLLGMTERGVEITGRVDAEWREDFLNHTWSARARWSF
jgi:uncharacterized protein with beta-barrel porin domain